LEVFVVLVFCATGNLLCSAAMPNATKK
jgi:hypothetical protein